MTVVPAGLGGGNGHTPGRVLPRVQLDAIPADLRSLPQWVGWRLVERPASKPTKQPLNPSTGVLASTTDSQTWGTFAEAVAMYQAAKADGIGFVFTITDPYVGVDLDRCRDPETSAVASWAMETIKRLSSYTEVSPSGTGVHIIVRGALPDGRRRKGPVEMYSDGRYFTVTGDRVPETPPTVEERTQVLVDLHLEVFGTPVHDPSERHIPGPGADVSDNEIVAKAKAAKNGAHFTRLWEGDWSGYPSHSEVDLALCSHLAYWTNGDPERMDRLFRQSLLMRPKWDERHGQRTYGQATISQALKGGRGGLTMTTRAASQPSPQVAAEDIATSSLSLWDTLPPFPPEAWDPVRAQTRDWLAPVTEAPFEFIFATTTLALATVVGREVYVQMGRRLFVNDYMSMVGPAAIRKGTPFAIIQEELLPLLDNANCRLRIIRGTGSAEGLLEQFMEEHEEQGQRGRPRKLLRPVPECRALGVEEEMGYLLVKAHAQATANVREVLCQLWDGVDIAPPTRGRSLVVERPFYSLLTMTTPETLEARLEEDDVFSGLLPRFVFFGGKPRAPISWPEAPSHSGAAGIAQALADLGKHTRQVRAATGGLVTASPAARQAWDEAYRELRQRALDAASPLVATMLTRIQTHLMKAALLYAMCAGHSQIQAQDLGRALSLGDYLCASASAAARGQLGNDVRRVERKALEVLEAAWPKWIPTRTLQQRLSGRIDSERFHRAIRAMAKMDVIETQPEGEVERPKLLRFHRSTVC